MGRLKHFFRNFKTKGLVNYFIGVYFFVAILMAYTGLNHDMGVVKATKPLLIPILLLTYLFKTTKYNPIFIFSLVAVSVSQFLSLSSSLTLVGLGLGFLIVYKILLLGFVKFTGFLEFGISSIPFAIIYLALAYLSNKGISTEIVLFLTQGLFIIVFGGFSLARYILTPSRANMFLMISAFLITGSQFLFALKATHDSITALEPLAMLIFAIGQFALFQYIILSENRKVSTSRKSRSKVIVLNPEPIVNEEKDLKVINFKKAAYLLENQGNREDVFYLN
jgi:hypothetical protein